MADVLTPPARFSRTADIVGPATIWALTFAYIALWWFAWDPATHPPTAYLGDAIGAVAVLELSLSVVLITVLPSVERWFNGIDRAALWHRRLAIIGTALLFVHAAILAAPAPEDAGVAEEPNVVGIVLASIGFYGLLILTIWAAAPRWRSLMPWLSRRVPLRTRPQRPGFRLLGNYEAWRTFHRLTGVFLAVGMLHGLLDATTFDSALLRISYLVIAGIGLAAFLYRELIARFFLPLHDYQVSEIVPVSEGVVEVHLTPIGRHLVFGAGQFAMLFLETKYGWRRHPFTLSGPPEGDVLRFAIKALGDDTRAVVATLRAGMPAIVGGPHGRFLATRGTPDQIWIAGGIGVTPMLGWLRAMDTAPGDSTPQRVVFVYTNDGPAPFGDEIADLARSHPQVELHVIDSSRDGHLTVEDVVRAADGMDLTQASVFLSGPSGLTRSLTKALRRRGVARTRIFRESFEWR